MDPDGNEKYQDPTATCKVYGKSLTTVSSFVTPFKFIDNIKLFMCSFASMPALGLNLASHFLGWAGN